MYKLLLVDTYNASLSTTNVFDTMMQIKVLGTTSLTSKNIIPDILTMF